MPAPIGLQLYTVRDAMNADFNDTVTKIAEMGYVGVETAGFPGTTPQNAAKLFADLGLEVSSAHSALPVGEQKNQVLDTMAALNCTRLICPALMREKFDSADGVREVCDVLNEAAEVCKENGLSLGYHNHYWEFTDFGDENASQVMFQNLDSSIFFELDTYWAQTAGHDPISVIKHLSTRVPFLHIKDGPATIEGDMVAAGSGVVDIPAIVEAGKEHIDWLVIELDRCATDMMEAVKKSYDYLVGEGLARGNR
ncbi:sugar phosphate isomerase/epimerase [Chloroflexi bacterium TSY]|nr:sugar phosphate isomerase/epimerase [Chloroflexi bacterium TSY]